MDKRKVRFMIEALITVGVFALGTIFLGWMIGIVCTVLGIVGLFLMAEK
ncbi:Hypothetical Protein OBI_RACECAR_234 [Arthrobacter phage Racecar]|nr:hypothetical protein PBI_RACECAR_26 [Arthrobacter phage Racecar]QFG12710.1 hypothetical protein PBI_MIMI_26 [Arthrobacter phage Mimi]